MNESNFVFLIKKYKTNIYTDFRESKDCSSYEENVSSLAHMKVT